MSKCRSKTLYIIYFIKEKGMFLLLLTLIFIMLYSNCLLNHGSNTLTNCHYAWNYDHVLTTTPRDVKNPITQNLIEPTKKKKSKPKKACLKFYGLDLAKEFLYPI